MSPDTIHFFEELAVNNNREWFMANKSRYNAIREEFIDLTAQIIDELSPLDPSIGHPDAKKCLYRIYRDLRFTQDKRPYKTHISFFLSSYGIKRSGEAGYYLQIGLEDYGLTGNCTLGGGIFMPDKDKLAAIRQEIFYNTDQFLAIRNDKQYKKYFGDGYFTTKILSRAPKGYPNDWEHVDLLKYNDYCTMHEVPNDILLSDKFKDYVMKVFRASVPLNRFILQATDQQ
ncbi:MAG: DUF2461 domain-containing protein [Bacteroidales bacterium]|nr:DUF2461 domain-containing protein [Bacteroidales bacterium]